MDVRETTRDNAHLRRRGFVDMRRWAYARVPVGTDETSECPRIRVVDRRIHRDLQIPMCCLPKSRTNEKVRISTIVFQKRARKHVMRKRERLALLSTTGIEGSVDDSMEPVAKCSLDTPESWMETGLLNLRRRWRALSLGTEGEFVVSMFTWWEIYNMRFACT
jgi:hypothetical protein